MEKKKITKADVEKFMDSPEAKMFRKTLNEVLEQAKEQLKEKLKMKKRIKLRDMTKEQWDNFLSKCYMNCDTCPFSNARCQKSESIVSWFNNKDLFSNKFLDQEVLIEEPDTLDEAEKEYLRAVIKPFRDRVIYIKKVKCTNQYFISIKINSKIVDSGEEYIMLPFFQNAMYIGMKSDKEYTLKDLDL